MDWNVIALDRDRMASYWKCGDEHLVSIKWGGNLTRRGPFRTRLHENPTSPKKYHFLLKLRNHIRGFTQFPQSFVIILYPRVQLPSTEYFSPTHLPWHKSIHHSDGQYFPTLRHNYLTLFCVNIMFEWPCIFDN